MFKPETEWRPVAEPPDPLPEAASEALRDATVSLWRDLYQKAQRVEALESENRLLRAELDARRPRIGLGRLRAEPGSAWAEALNRARRASCH